MGKLTWFIHFFLLLKVHLRLRPMWLHSGYTCVNPSQLSRATQIVLQLQVECVWSVIEQSAEALQRLKINVLCSERRWEGKSRSIYLPVQFGAEGFNCNSKMCFSFSSTILPKYNRVKWIMFFHKTHLEALEMSNKQSNVFIYSNKVPFVGLFGWKQAPAPNSSLCVGLTEHLHPPGLWTKTKTPLVWLSSASWATGSHDTNLSGCHFMGSCRVV